MQRNRHQRHRLTMIGLLALGVVAGTLAARADGASRYRVSGWTWSAGGGTATGTSRGATSIAGTPNPAGRCAAGRYQAESGFALPGVMRRLLRFALAPGWNLKGAPGATDGTIDDIFRGAAGAPVKVGAIRYWNAETNEYEDGVGADPLVGGWGFWVFSYWGGESRTFEYADEARFPWEEALRPGWNLYSPPCYVTVPRNNADLLAVWQWHAGLGAYEPVYPGHNLIPGEGYWILKRE
jgi:hypothetical protein